MNRKNKRLVRTVYWSVKIIAGGIYVAGLIFAISQIH